MDSGVRMLFLVRCYIFPDGALKIESVVVAIIQGPCRSALQVAGGFNADLTVLEGNHHVEDILASLSATVLEEMSAQFLPFCKYWAWERRAWCMHLQGREGRPHTDYFIGI